MAKREIEIIRRTVSILDSVDYKRYSEGKANTYLEYASGAWTDERKLIAPILFPKFLEQVLNFKLGETVGTQETAPEGGDIPDYIPTDTRTHPFVFDCKGMDTFDLCKWYDQIKRYLQAQNLKYGILVNMRDLDVYTLESKEEIEAFNFNFVELYKDFKEKTEGILEKENTKRFLNFAESFSYKPLTKEGKIERIAKAKPWTGKEELNVKSLTDQLRHIVNILHSDVKQQKSELISKAKVGRVSGESIAYEIEEISARISGRELEEVSSETFERIMNADEATVYGKARDAFSSRVAYFAMTRLLLARVWEDIDFIEPSLYNGGFARLYENFNHKIRRVLHYAFDLSADQYPWLFNVNNNYSWYEPSDDSLIDSLYELSNFYLGKLDQDILGTIYEDYIERVDKKNKGQYYTPREIVSFIWDRVGYHKPGAYFWYIEGKRVPKFIFDPATGSGGFLVEAARRIRECPDLNWDDLQDLKDIWRAILWYIFGSEISSFPYYLTQVNLLIQLTPVIRRILELTGKKPREEPTPLGIICRDSMELHNPEQLPLQEVRGEEKEHQHKILHFTTAEQKIHEKIKGKFAEKFSYVCANPPYIGEKGHKELFQRTLKLYPYWKNYYQGKMNYLQWFIILGLSKLRQWGKLGFITSAYWLTANGASKLRKHILENAKIKEMILFRDVKIFEHAKGQDSMVFVLTKCSGKDKEQERENNHIKIVTVKCRNQDLEGETIRENLAFLTKHIQKYIDDPRYEDEYMKVFWSEVRQGKLSKDGGAWNAVFLEESSSAIFGKIEKENESLTVFLETKQGIVPGIDRVTPQHLKYVPKWKLESGLIKRGDGVFVLSKEEANSLITVDKDRELLVPSYRNSHISPYFVDIPEGEKEFILYIDREIDLKEYLGVKNHLERYREMLEARLQRYEERGYKESYPWYRLNRPRDRKMLESEKLVVSNWGNEWQPYAYQTGCFFETRDVTIFTKKPGVKESIFYLLALLNSKLIRQWMNQKARQVGYMRQKLQEQIPIHRIDFDNPEDVQLHDEIVQKVKAIREKMAELAGYSKYFKGPRLTRLKFEDCLPDLNLEAIVQSLPPQNKFSLRTHPAIRITYSSGFQDAEFILSKVGEVSMTLEGAELKLYGKDRKVLYINGEEKLLKIITQILKNHQREHWTSIKEMPFIPQNSEEFETKKQEIFDTASKIRIQIHELQNSIDTIVLGLCDVPESLSG